MQASSRASAKRRSASRRTSTPSARSNTRSSDSTRLSINTLAAGDRITAFKDSGRQQARAQYRNVYTWGALDHDWSDTSSTRVILSYTDVNNERSGEVNDPARRVGQVRDIRNFHVIGLRADQRFDLLGLDHRAGFEVRRLWGRYDYASDVTFAAGFPFADSPGSRLQRTAAAETGRLRVRDLVGQPLRARESLDGAGRAAVRHADVRRLERRGAESLPGSTYSMTSAQRRACARAGAGSSRRRASTSCRSRTASSASIGRSMPIT